MILNTKLNDLKCKMLIFDIYMLKIMCDTVFVLSWAKRMTLKAPSNNRHNSVTCFRDARQSRTGVCAADLYTAWLVLNWMAFMTLSAHSYGLVSNSKFPCLLRCQQMNMTNWRIGDETWWNWNMFMRKHVMYVHH